MLRRFVAIAILALTLNFALVGPAQAEIVEGPPCSDIAPSANGIYSVNASGAAVFTLTFFTTAPRCDFVTYQLVVTPAGQATTIAVFGVDPNLTSCGSTCLNYTKNYGAAATAPSSVSFHAETLLGPTHIADRAPNIGEIVFVLCEPIDDPNTPIPGCAAPDFSMDS